MTRILLVDDSPHAQRMGERILSEEGFQVVTLSNGDSALIRLEDVDPDIVVADTVMPGRTGYEICQFLKMSPRHRHVKVILTAGVLEPLDDEQVKRVQADATLKKPFEATALLAAVKPLAARAAQERPQVAPAAASGLPPGTPSGTIKITALAPPLGAPPFVAVVDAEQVRAAVTVALDASMEKMVDEIAARVLKALQTRQSGADRPAATLRAAEPPVTSRPAQTAPPPVRPAEAAPQPPAETEHRPPADPTPKSLAETAPKPVVQSAPRAPAETAPKPLAQLASQPPADATPQPLAETAPKPVAQSASQQPEQPASQPPAVPVLGPLAEAAPQPASPPVAEGTPRLETVRRVNALRSRPGSFLGLDFAYVEPEVPSPAPRPSAPDTLFSNTRPAADPDPGPRPPTPDKK